MRARNLKPGFFKSTQLLKLKPLTRILFAGLWGLADKSGRLKDDPLWIKLEVLPNDRCDVDKMLSELQEVELIKRYSVNGVGVIWIVKFLEHQNPHWSEKDSKLPEFDMKNQSLLEHSGNFAKKRDESGILNPESGILNHESVAPEAVRLSELLRALITANDPKARTPKDLTPWVTDMDRLLRLDKRTPQETEAVIRWCQADPFWRSNILSASKLREKFSQLSLKMKEPKGGSDGRGRFEGLPKPVKEIRIG